MTVYKTGSTIDILHLDCVLIKLLSKLSKLMTRIGYEYNKLRPSLEYMDLQTRRIVINAKVRTHVEYILPLIIAQPQYVQNKVFKILMKLNRWTLRENTFKIRNTTICKKIGCPTPQQELLRVSYKFIHNLILNNQTKSLTQLLQFPRRSTSKISYIKPKKAHFKTPLEHMVELYNQQDVKLRKLSKPQLQRTLKKLTLKYRQD